MRMGKLTSRFQQALAELPEPAMPMPAGPSAQVAGAGER